MYIIKYCLSSENPSIKSMFSFQTISSKNSETKILAFDFSFLFFFLSFSLSLTLSLHPYSSFNIKSSERYYKLFHFISNRCNEQSYIVFYSFSHRPILVHSNHINKKKTLVNKTIVWDYF